MKIFFVIIALLSCFFTTTNATPMKLQYELVMIYKSGGGLIGDIELAESSTYVMRVWIASGINHVRIDWRDSGGSIVASQIFTRTTNQGYADIPHFGTYYFTISAEKTDVGFGGGTIQSYGETRYYNVNHVE